MLKKLKVHNFKSLVNFEIKFDKQFQAIIGPNNSGKTNIIDALNFLSKLTKNLELSNVIKREQGFNRLLHYNAKEKVIRFEIEIESNNNTYFYELEFSIDYILKEKLLLNKEIQLEGFEGKGKAFDSIENDFKEFTLNARNLALNQLWDIERYPIIREFSKILQSFKTYMFIPSMMREPTIARKEIDPEQYGEKIVQVLHSILTTERNTYEEIVEIMKSVFDEITDINSPIDDKGLINIEILEKGFDKEFDINQISDGTLRFLAFLTIIHLQKKFSIFCFEEPELYFHPYLLDKLIALLKDLNIQVIITTHSPQILNLLEPEDLIIISKTDGRTNCQKLPTMPEILNKLKNDGFLLGELWTMGEFDNA